MLAKTFLKKKKKKKIEYMNQNNDTKLRKEKKKKNNTIKSSSNFKTTNIKTISFIYVYFFTELKIYLLSYFYLQTLPYRHC